MQTLFILSLPRSLSTLVYHVARLSLGLNEPKWTTDGEIMNNDRYILYTGKGYNESLKYIREKKEQEIFNRLYTFLDQTVMPQDFIYKDVVNPFIVAQWLKNNSTKVLKIKRQIADIAYSMLTKQWYYPAMATDEKGNLEGAVIQGLMMAEEAIEHVPGVTIHYDLLVQDDQEINQALKHLYPEENVTSMGFIDDQFRHQSQQVLERRESIEYKRIAEIILKQKNQYNSIREKHHEKRNNINI